MTKSYKLLAIAGLFVVGGSTQDFAIQPVGFISSSEISSDGGFSLVGELKAGGPAMSDGNFEISGEFRSLINASAFSMEELIGNGSFENIENTFVPDRNGLMALSAGSTTIPGWTLSNGELAWGDNANAFGIMTPFGKYLVDLTGYFGPNATISQTIATVPGRNYRLSLSIGSNASFPGPKLVSVCAGGGSKIFIMSATNNVGDQWEKFSFTFPAIESSTAISVGGIAGGAYIGLDNVSVVADYAPPPPESANLVVNGSFEIVCPVSFAPDGNGVMSLPAGSTLIPGWRTMTAEIGWGANANTFGPRSPFGSLFLDLTGYHDSAPYGGITQTLATTPNQNYVLSFSVGSQQDLQAYRGPMTISVTAGSVSDSFTFSPTGSGSQWGTFSMPFVAESATTDLTFNGTTSTGGGYLGLDNVSVTIPSGGEPFYLTGVHTAGGHIRFHFPASPGGSYVVEGRSDLSAGQWLVVQNATFSNESGKIHVSIPIPAGEQNQFYRAKKLL